MNRLNFIGFLDKNVLFPGSIKEYPALSSELSGSFRPGHISRDKTGLIRYETGEAKWQSSIQGQITALRISGSDASSTRDILFVVTAAQRPDGRD
jgi:hypothetical protein